MQNLGSEVCQLSSLLEVQLVNRLCAINHAWVVVVHTVDISPDLNLVSSDSSTNQRCSIVGTTTLQVVDLAISVATDEALSEVNLSTLVLLHQCSQLLLDVNRIGLCVLVSTHKVERVEQHGLDANLVHVVNHHVGRDNLALSHDALLLEAGKQLLGERTQVVELALQELACSGLGLVLGIKLVNVLVVLLLQAVDNLVSAIGVLLIEIIRDLYKRVCGARHS